MASLQKYFDYSFGTRCGIPGVEMTGSEDDWIRLAEKTKNLEALLMPIMEGIELGKWSVFLSLDHKGCNFQPSTDVKIRILLSLCLCLEAQRVP